MIAIQNYTLLNAVTIKTSLLLFHALNQNYMMVV